MFSHGYNKAITWKKDASLADVSFTLSPQTAENYFYVPDLGQVPEIDVPSYLPDLPGIADDLMYSADLGPGFAPSVPASNSIPELPSFGTEHDESSGSGGIISNILLWRILNLKRSYCEKLNFEM